MDGIKKLAHMWGLVLDPDLQTLFPRDNRGYKNLEESIRKNGFDSNKPLIVDKRTNTLVDGYSRLEICERLIVSFNVRYIEFESKADMIQYAYDEQKDRRNLNEAQWIEAVTKFESAVKAAAKERQREGINQYTGRLPENFPEGTDARDQLGAMAHVSGKTYEKGAEVFNKAPEEVKEMYRAGEISTYAAHKVTQMDKEKQDEFIKRTKDGEKPKEVIRSITERKGESGNPNGFPLSVRASRAETRKIYEEMRSGNVVHEFTIDDLTEDIRVNADVYIGMLDSTLKERSGLITTETSHQVVSAIDNVINKITDIRRRYA